MQIMNLKNFFKNLAIWLKSRNLDYLPESVVIIDRFGGFVFANKMALNLFNIRKSDIENTNMNKFITNFSDFIQIALTSKKSVLVALNISEKKIYAECNASKIGKNWLCATFRNCTKLTSDTETDEKIARFNGEKNAMLAQIEEEFKSPISSIIGFSHGLLEGLGGELSEKQEKYVKIINNVSLELSEFSDNFFEFSRAESSLYKPEYKNFDIVELIKNCANSQKNKIGEREIYFDFEYEQIDERTINSDFKGIQTALTKIYDVSLSTVDNGTILTNIEYAKDEDKLEFRLDLLKPYIKILIRDFGSGFDKQELKHLCDPYFQLDKGRKNILRSLKLGTAGIILNRCGANFDINSEMLKGSIYKIIIPVKSNE